MHESPSFVLVGTIIGPGGAVALLQDPSTQKVVPLRLGEKFQGWRLRAVEQREVTVEKDISRVALQLPKQEAQGYSPTSTTGVPTAAEFQRPIRGRVGQRQ